jgi:hypothetical protein
VGRKAKGLLLEDSRLPGLPVYDLARGKHRSWEVIMARLLAGKVAWLLACILVLMLSLMAGTALSALFFKAVEL